MQRRPFQTSLRGCGLVRPAPQPRSHMVRPVIVNAAGTFAADGAEEEEPDDRRQRRGRRRDREDGPRKEREEDDGFKERVVQVSRVTKVVKGGKQLSFRAVVVVGDEKGQVGVGVAGAKEVVNAVQTAVKDAKKHLVKVPLTRNFSFPHRIDGIAGAAKVMLRPASDGTGVIAGGSVRVVLEMAGIKNAFGKQLGSPNPLNNARATVDGLANMRTIDMVAQERDLTVSELLGYRKEAKPEAVPA